MVEARRATGTAACDCPYTLTPPLPHNPGGSDAGLGNATPDLVNRVAGNPIASLRDILR